MKARLLLLTFLGAGCTVHKLASARSVIAEQSQCAEPLVFVRELQQGWLGRGCNQYWMCSGYDGPCSQVSCAEAAEQELLSCRIATHTHYLGEGSRPALVVGPVHDPRDLDDCAVQYTNTVCQCPEPVAAQ